MKRMEYIFIPTQEDIEKIRENYEAFSQYEDEKLVSFYNGQVKLGILAVKAQIILIVACGMVCKKRFGFNPVDITDNCVIGLSKQIVLENKSIHYIE